jgi:hypothetical protein
MAKEIFVTRWFSEEMLAAGKTLISRLAVENVECAAAFWLLDDNEQTWGLNIISAQVDAFGPREYYKKINNTNKQALPDEAIISLHDIHVSGMKNKLIDAFKQSVLFGAKLGDKRLGKQYIGGIFIEDMYLYKLDWDLIAHKSAGITHKSAA